MGPGDLAQALCGLDFGHDPNLIVGLEKADDAGVYKLREDLAIIQTVDFFTPIVDDPYMFGQISAANSLSDVYAMGGKPICAMNIAGFPAATMDIMILHEIFRGGLAKMKEAGVTLVGGHTVEDPELKYGLSVTGIVHPDAVLTNRGALAGDALILTKPIGTGAVNTAIKAEMASEELIAQVTALMATLNARAAEIMVKFEVHACTDVTGFGLLGHACEMIEESLVGMNLDAQAIPIISEALEFARMGLLPAGLYRNRDFRAGMVVVEDSVPLEMADILFDPQTSGGLLIAVPNVEAPRLLKALHAGGIPSAAVIGRVTESHPGKVDVH